MRPFKGQAKRVARVVLSRLWGKTVPILIGPLKGKRLPKSIALQYFQMLWGDYEPEVVVNLLSLVKPWSIAYDVGANVGYLTLALARGLEKGRIYAFEPLPENQVILREMIASNNLETKVMVISKALSNLDGQQNLYLNRSPSMGFLEAALDGQKVNDLAKMMVDTSTLDTFVFEKLNPAPDILKIDVEGGELLVLEGGLRTLKEFRPRILIEIHGSRNAQKIWDLLEELPYSWWHLTLRGRNLVPSEKTLLSFFSAVSWTHHYLLLPTPFGALSTPEFGQ